jgi:hypothetical protein
MAWVPTPVGLVTTFSHIDCMMIESVWVIEQAELNRKKPIAKEHAHENIRFVKSVVEQHMKLDIQETWNVLTELRQERNLIAHGVWSVRFGGDSPDETAVPPTGLPMVLWHSKMLESDDYVTAESFDYWRFDKFMQRARLLLNNFRQFKAMCEKAIEEEKQSPRESHATPPRQVGRLPRSGGPLSEWPWVADARSESTHASDMRPLLPQRVTSENAWADSARAPGTTPIREGRASTF